MPRVRFASSTGGISGAAEIAAKDPQNPLHKCLAFEHSTPGTDRLPVLYWVGFNFGAVSFIATK